jgi:DNA-binding MarR family transcriptional regulator
MYYEFKRGTMAIDDTIAREEFRKRFSHQLKTLFNLEDTRGIETFSLMHRLARVGELLGSYSSDEVDLSGPRWRLMLRLFIEENMGNKEGLTPTDLSRWQRVSKNSTSSLLRGLEEQGLIQRTLDPKDLRVFRIQLTASGRDLVLRTGPMRIEHFNELLSGLEPDEIDQLNALLEKLMGSITAQYHDKLHDKLIEQIQENPTNNG